MPSIPIIPIKIVNRSCLATDQQLPTKIQLTHINTPKPIKFKIRPMTGDSSISKNRTISLPKLHPENPTNKNELNLLKRSMLNITNGDYTKAIEDSITRVSRQMKDNSHKVSPKNEDNTNEFFMGDEDLSSLFINNNKEDSIEKNMVKSTENPTKRNHFWQDEDLSKDFTTNVNRSSNFPMSGLKTKENKVPHSFMKRMSDKYKEMSKTQIDKFDQLKRISNVTSSKGLPVRNKPIVMNSSRIKTVENFSIDNTGKDSEVKKDQIGEFDQESQFLTSDIYKASSASKFFQTMNKFNISSGSTKGHIDLNDS